MAADHASEVPKSARRMTVEEWIERELAEAPEPTDDQWSGTMEILNASRRRRLGIDPDPPPWQLSEDE